MRSALTLLAAVAAGFGLLSGCDSASTTAPEPPAGGTEYILDFAQFETEVAPVLSAHGCDSIACHGGGIRGTFALSPGSNKDLDFDFAQASLQVWPTALDQSPLLTKPLAEAAGGTFHTADPGVSGFTTADDPGFQALQAWVHAGVER